MKAIYTILILTLLFPIAGTAHDDHDNRTPDFPRFRAWISAYRVNDASFNGEKQYSTLPYFGAGLEYILTDRVGVKMTAGCSFPELRDNPDLSDDEITRVFWQGELLITYHFNPARPLDIFLQAGLGSMGGVRIPDTATDPADEADVGLFVYATAGAGANYFFDRHFFIGAEARWILSRQAISAEGLKTFEAGDFQLGVKAGFAL